jgi:dynein heavy chain
LPAKPEEAWVLDKMWAEICRLSDLPAFQGFYEDFEKDLAGWKDIFDTSTPHEDALPG